MRHPAPTRPAWPRATLPLAAAVLLAAVWFPWSPPPLLVLVAALLLPLALALYVPWAVREAVHAREPGWSSARPPGPRWGSAADTVVEHSSEAEARVYEDVCTIVVRWPSGPWVDAGTGRVWDGDPEADRIRREAGPWLRSLGWRPPEPETVRLPVIEEGSW